VLRGRLEVTLGLYSLFLDPVATIICHPKQELAARNLGPVACPTLKYKYDTKDPYHRAEKGITREVVSRNNWESILHAGEYMTMWVH
jgi:hypothetical protein